MYNRIISGLRKVSRKIMAINGLGLEAMNFDDAPGADLTFDEIFGEPSNEATTPATPTGTPNPKEETTSSQPFLKTSTGTVYNSAEEAVRGVEHKDAIILKLRQDLAEKTGRDPLTSQRQPEPTRRSYLEDNDAYFSDVAKAVEAKDTKGYMEAQQRLIYDALGPLAPTLIGLSKAHAEQAIVSEIPDFRGFTNSDYYKSTLNSSPLLADAIRTAESNPAASGQLTELYRMAYFASQGQRLPEIVQASQRANETVTARPTLQSTPMTPPAVTGQPVVKPSLDTKDGRKAIIEAMESQGIADKRW